MGWGTCPLALCFTWWVAKSWLPQPVVLKWEGFQLGKWNTSVQVILPDLIKQKEKLQILTAIMNLVSASKRLRAEARCVFVNREKKNGVATFIDLQYRAKKWLVSNSLWGVKEAVGFPGSLHSLGLAWSSREMLLAEVVSAQPRAGVARRWQSYHSGKETHILGKAVLVQKSSSLFNVHTIKLCSLFLLKIILVLKAFELQYFLEKHSRRAGTTWSLMSLPSQTILWFCENPKCYSVRPYTQLEFYFY